MGLRFTTSLYSLIFIKNRNKMSKSKSLFKTAMFAVLGGCLLLSPSCKKKEEATPEPANAAPVVSNIQVNPTNAEPGSTVIISVTATDADKDELSYSYEVNGGSISGSGASVAWAMPNGEGSYTVTVSVSDGKDSASKTANISVVAAANNIPVINSITVNPSSANPGETVTITVNATDVDNHSLNYVYQVTGGAVSGNGSNVSWTVPSQAGAFSVNVTVTDGHGGQAMGNAAITVNALTTQINGTASFPAGTSGDLTNAKVSIYTSYDNWNQNNPLQFVAATGNGSNISFTISDMPAGVYYLDVWKDVDNSGGWSYGDYVGWYGNGGLGSPSLTEISILEGETKNLSISMMIINGKMMQNIKQIQ